MREVLGGGAFELRVPVTHGSLIAPLHTRESTPRTQPNNHTNNVNRHAGCGAPAVGLPLTRARRRRRSFTPSSTSESESESSSLAAISTSRRSPPQVPYNSQSSPFQLNCWQLFCPLCKVCG